MTAKEALFERIERMTDDEATELLLALEWSESDVDVLSPEAMEQARLGRAENERGETVPSADLFRRLGL